MGKQGIAATVLVLLAFVFAFAAATAGAASEEASRGDVTATISWEEGDEYGWQDLWLTVTRAGEPVYDRALDFRGCEEPACVPSGALPGYASQPTIVVRDLDGDREPEVVAKVLTSTGHCCTVAVLLRRDGYGYRRSVRDFGEAGYRLGTTSRGVRFFSDDPRFTYAFASRGGSWHPPQVWQYAKGGFRDVTRSHPALVRQHARAAWRAYRRDRPSEVGVRYGGGALAAWVADQRLLGNGRHAHATLDRLRRAGLLDDFSGFRSATHYLSTLETKLRRWGY